MQLRRSDIFITVRSEGAILPADLLQRIAEGDRRLGGLSPEDYHLAGNEKLNEAANRSWNRLLGAWLAFKDAGQKLRPEDPATSLTRERWLLVLFQELGYGRLQTSRAAEVDGKSYPISHFWHHIPIHLVGRGTPLDRRTAGVAGAAKTSPHSLVQEYLNRSNASLWGMVSNGLRLRVLRDNVSLTRQAFVEFDLEAMMNGEVYSDFALLWLLCHQSRVEGEKPDSCWLEQWSRLAHEQGTRALDQLRDGVAQAIEALGRGFLHLSNTELRDRLRTGALDKQDYYRQLLRLVYRLLFLFVSEDRNLLSDPDAGMLARERYARFYSTARLRRLAEKRRGTRHTDLFEGLCVVMRQLGADEGCPELSLPALGSFLFSDGAIPDLNDAVISNEDFLNAIRALALTADGKTLRIVDYRNLGAEELGSVYESLLELHPELNLDAGTFSLSTAGGNERKTTGSYYTPTSLITCLLDSALDPVIEEACSKPDPEKALLGLKVCDPACGSGHFLIAAAHRIAKRLAALRTGDEEPSPEATRTALRDIIGRCIYGVDVNEMAVELCKVALWMEALEPGKPLSFLDHRIRCGNSLLGTTPALLSAGIPDDAFTPIEGDEKSFASALKKLNKVEHNQMSLPLAAEDEVSYGSFADKVAYLDSVDDDSISGVREKEESYTRLSTSGEYRRAKLLADAWCAAFVWKKQKDAPQAVTQDIFRRLRKARPEVPLPTISEIQRITTEYNFFHWHLAFPDVFRLPPEGQTQENPQAGWNGGFDVVLGNPPWERPKPEPAKFFSVGKPEIACAATSALRERLLSQLETEDPELFYRWKNHERHVMGQVNSLTNAGLYPLTARGKFNLGSTFVELSRNLLRQTGRSGMLIISGLATDDSGTDFIADIMGKRALVSFFDFENREGLFPGVDSRYRFSAITVSGTARPSASADFVFYAQQTSELTDEYRHIAFTEADIRLLNPISRNCPVFRDRRTADLVKQLYRRADLLPPSAPVLFRWDAEPTFLFVMSDHSSLFLTSNQVCQDGSFVGAHVACDDSERALRLYESKMFHQYEHRWADISEGQQIPISILEREDPFRTAVPRYWMRLHDANTKLDRLPNDWLLAIREVTNATNERTVIAAVIPKVPVGHNGQVFRFNLSAESACCFLSILNSFVLDFASRTKVGGSHLSSFILRQLPVLPADVFAGSTPWDEASRFQKWVSDRVLELVYTAWDLSEFARDCVYEGPPFRWDEDRRFLIRCELDAAFFHLYGLNRDDSNYIMDTFPIVKRKDEDKFGEYRTKRVILEIYEAMSDAIRSGQPYATRLDPAPADSRVAHIVAAGVTAGIASAGPEPLPFRRVHPGREEKYQTCVPLLTLRAAAGAFSEDQVPEFGDWVEFKTSHTLRKGMFVAQIVGQSMEPLIPDGSYCLFRYPAIVRQKGEIVLAQLHGFDDPETGGSFTVKRIRSERVTSVHGNLQTRIRLEPLNPAFPPILIEEGAENVLQIIAEFIEVL